MERFTAWHAALGVSTTPTELHDFFSELEENPNVKSSAILYALKELQDELSGIPSDADLDATTVPLSLPNAALLARVLLSRIN